MYLQGGLPQSKKGICAHSHADGPASCSSIQLWCLWLKDSVSRHIKYRWKILCNAGIGKSTRELMYIRAVKHWCRQQHLRSVFCLQTPHGFPALSSPERVGETKPSSQPRSPVCCSQKLLFCCDPTGPRYIEALPRISSIFSTSTICSESPPKGEIVSLALERLLKRIHKGGFGKVYKGRLADGSLVAVKRLKEDRTPGGELQFQTEVEMISMAVHSNLLRLCSFCMTPTERLLFYPYMVNGSVASCFKRLDI
ncbi:hypothetical protein MRB53_035936 [Persea americana]|uniref:Uncharacterized protein n=1 Tax=Persea americana TaxID=3435 RepID=A0ACC2K624_PERAE|nr:hypothetical protein MRB53_035936 [Persea americana]